MKTGPDGRLDLAYCLNVHPGESWAENVEAMQTHVPAVREAVAPGMAFGLGLRVGSRALRELREGNARAEAADWFRQADLYPFTINGFPYGEFHRASVKETVYQPDWQTAERRDYTIGLGGLLADWLPEGGEGSISTVPGSYAVWITRPDQAGAMARNLAETALAFARLEETTGRLVHLGLEPEPDCFLQTTAETIRFFEEVLLREGTAHLMQTAGMDRGRAETVLRRHAGVCFDTCHLALQEENLADSFRAFGRAGLRISKVQISCALEIDPTSEGWEALRPFVEPVYLHQVKALRRDGGLASWPDLPPALEDGPALSEELRRARVHFHVPLFFGGAGPLRSTSSTLTPEFFEVLRRGDCRHVEIETYTFDVLPASIKPATLTESLIREYQWLLPRLRE